MIPTIFSYQHDDEDDYVLSEIIPGLTRVYENSVRAIEERVLFSDLYRKHPHFSGFDPSTLAQLPIVSVLGPYSSGKTAFLRTILGADYSRHLRVGEKPTTDKFTAVTFSDTEEVLHNGGAMVNSRRSPFFGLGEQLGADIVAPHVLGVALPCELLRDFIFIDTPGMQDRASTMVKPYNFDHFTQWVFQRSALVIFMIDPLKNIMRTFQESINSVLLDMDRPVIFVMNKIDLIKADPLDVISGVMFSLGAVMQTAEVPTLFYAHFGEPEAVPLPVFQEQKNATEELFKALTEVRGRVMEVKVSLLLTHLGQLNSYLKRVKEYQECCRRNKKSYFFTQLKMEEAALCFKGNADARVGQARERKKERDLEAFFQDNFLQLYEMKSIEREIVKAKKITEEVRLMLGKTPTQLKTLFESRESDAGQEL